MRASSPATAVRRHADVRAGMRRHNPSPLVRRSRAGSVTSRRDRRAIVRGAGRQDAEAHGINDAAESTSARECAREGGGDDDAPFPRSTTAPDRRMHEDHRRHLPVSSVVRTETWPCSPSRPCRRLLAMSLMTGVSAAVQLVLRPAVAHAKGTPPAPVDMHTPAASFNLPVPPSADFQLAEFDLPGPERRKMATPPYRRQRKKMNSFVREAAERVGPCVVRIDMDFQPSHRRGSFEHGLLHGGGVGGGRGHGQGCGLVFDGDAGLVITNAHVVDGQGRVKVTFTDGRVYNGTVMGSDALTDIALVRVEPRPDHKLPRVPPMGDSATLEVGDWVIALGNPFGLDNTITLGIVSNLHRTSAELGIPDRRVDFLQTDCAINPGNSGGPLVNEFGEVVAINTAIRADAEGIGFAIPINDVQQVVRLLAAGQRVQHPFIGIQMVTLAPGTYVGAEGGGRAGGRRTGLDTGDPGEASTSTDRMKGRVGSNGPVKDEEGRGDGEGPVNREAVANASSTPGVEFEALDALPLFPPRRGVLIVKVLPDSPAALAGLRVGDVCVTMQGQMLWDAAQVQKEVNAAKPGQLLTMTILREGRMMELTLRTVDLAPIAKARGFANGGMVWGYGGNNSNGYNGGGWTHGSSAGVDNSSGASGKSQEHGSEGGGSGQKDSSGSREKVSSPPGMGLYPRSYGDVGGHFGTARGGTRDA